MRFNIVLLLLINTFSIAYSQHGAYIAPVMKVTSVNGQTAIIAGGKAGWIINNRFVIGGAFYGLVTDVGQSWIDPIAGSAPFITFNTGGLNLEYIFFRSELFSMSAELFMGGAGLKFIPRDNGTNNFPLYGGDFLIWEPQLNTNVHVTDWFHVSLGLNYRTTSLMDVYLPPTPEEPNSPAFEMKNLRGASAVLSLIFGMY